jgi:hypothetical protein
MKRETGSYEINKQIVQIMYAKLNSYRTLFTNYFERASKINVTGITTAVSIITQHIGRLKVQIDSCTSPGHAGQSVDEVIHFLTCCKSKNIQGIF